MGRFVLNLLDGDRFDPELDSNDSLDDLIQDQIEMGWEDDPHRLIKMLLTITLGPGGQIVATFYWLAVTGQEWPDLILTTDGDTRCYRRTEGGGDEPYSSTRIDSQGRIYSLTV